MNADRGGQRPHLTIGGQPAWSLVRRRCVLPAHRPCRRHVPRPLPLRRCRSFQRGGTPCRPFHHDSASIEIDAPPQVVFNLITDIHQLARFSPELVSCRWLDGADRAALGPRFEAVNQVPGHRPWKNRPVVTVYESHQRFAIPSPERSFGPMTPTATATRRP
jgi:hypothetical protein